MRDWIRFFVGTPQRLIGTVVVGVVVLGLLKPGVMEQAVTGLLNALWRAASPLFEPVLTVAIVLIGFIMIFRSLRRRK